MTRHRPVNPHEHAVTDANRRGERTDVVMFVYKRIEELMAESKALGFCQYARDLRVQARALYELAYDIGGCTHLDCVDDRFNDLQ